MVITATELRKSFRDVEALRGVDIDVAGGSVFALLGPNGAGKTTLVRILATLLPPDSGVATVAGHDVVREPRAVQAAISLTGQYAAVDDLLTGEENLLMIARLRRLGRAGARRRTAELLERFGLAQARRRLVKTYSGGMRRKLDLAMSLLGSPSVVFLDEPTTGLDPRSRQSMWDTVRELVAGGVTILLTTQYLEEADQLADRVALIDHGRIVAEGSPEELKHELAGERLELRMPDTEAYDRAVSLLGDRTAAADPERFAATVATDGSAAQVRAVLDRLDRHGIEVTKVALHRPTLDDVFLTLTRS